MATAKYAQIQSSSLDFDSIKSSLKTYLQTQDVFQGYSFEGSSLNILLDVLAANTHYYAAYTSMAANEMFLDTAILRSNVVSNAKNLGYSPRSNIAAFAKVKVEISAKNAQGQALNLGSFVSMPKGTLFNSTVDGVPYRFVTSQEYLLANVGPGLYGNSDVTLKEGTLLKKSFVVSSVPGQKFQILDPNIDTSTIKLWIQESATNLTSTDYSYTKSILGLTSNSHIYMVQESADGNFEIVFGDNVIGKKPVAGNIITLEYLSTTPGQGNGCNVFSLVNLIIPGQTHTVTTITSSSGSSVKETIDSIKLHARYNFESQGRAVIPLDYKTTILQAFPELLDVNVWGGEDNIPVKYGKVMISPLARSLTKITSVKKDEIVAAIKKLNVMNIVPEIVDPQVTVIKLSGHVNYKETVQTISASTIKGQVIDALLQYNRDYLQKFTNGFSYSQALGYITNSNTAITNSFFRVSIISPIVVLNGNLFSYTIELGNQLRPNTMTSDPFTLSVNSLANTLYYLEDDGLGNIELYGITNGDISSKFYTGELHGTINYTTGSLLITNLQIIPYLSPYNVNVIVEPYNYDVIPTFNQILTIDQSQLIVDAIPVV